MINIDDRVTLHADLAIHTHTYLFFIFWFCFLSVFSLFLLYSDNDNVIKKILPFFFKPNPLPLQHVQRKKQNKNMEWNVECVENKEKIWSKKRKFLLWIIPNHRSIWLIHTISIFSFGSKPIFKQYKKKHWNSFRFLHCLFSSFFWVLFNQIALSRHTDTNK